MPLKDGPMPKDSEVDVSASSKTDRSTCNKLICKLGYTNEDNLRYPMLIREVYAQLKKEEGGDGNKAQQRNLYKKLTHCNPNYPEAKDIPTRRECVSSPLASNPYSSFYRPPPRQPSSPKTRKAPRPKKQKPTAASVAVSKDNFKDIREFINGPTKNAIQELFERISALQSLALTTSDMISQTHDNKLYTKMKGVYSNITTIHRYQHNINTAFVWRTIQILTDQLEDVFLKYYKEE